MGIIDGEVVGHAVGRFIGDPLGILVGWAVGNDVGSRVPQVFFSNHVNVAYAHQIQTSKDDF